MSDSEYFEWPENAQAITADNLTTVRARLAYSACLNHPYFSLIDVTFTEIGTFKFETLIVDVTPDIIQVPVFDILYTERLAIVFNTDENTPIWVYALRKTFPTVPHLNRVPSDTPKSLCIDDMDYEERKLTWTVEGMLMNIVNWLELTARGTLHQPGQSLEPLFHDDASSIVLPTDFEDEEKRKNSVLLYSTSAATNNSITHILDWQDVYEKIRAQRGNRPLPIQLLYIEGEPQPHGIIDDSPLTLFALHEVIQKANIDLIPTLTEFIKSLVRSGQYRDNDLLLIVFKLPITRQAGGDVERTDPWAFYVKGSLKEIGKNLRALTNVGGSKTQVYDDRSNEPLTNEEDMSVTILNSMDHLTPTLANQYNNLPENTHERQFAMIGCGALGSTLLDLYCHMGFGQWVITDHDKLLPHNIARHRLPRSYLGQSKAQAFAVDTTLLFYETRVTAFTENFLKITGDSDFVKQFDEIEAIIDVSASIAVARKLALDIETPARKISVFITPSGQDSVLIAEDTGKLLTLDLLEAQYYRELTSHHVGATHLGTSHAQHRYGGGCRELSAIMPYDTITAHAAILSSQIRCTLDNPTARLAIWQHDDETGSISHLPLRIVQSYTLTLGDWIGMTDETGSISHLPLRIVQSYTLTLGDWTVIYDQCLLDKMIAQRQEALPNETGGPFVGYFDMLRQRIYLVDSLPSPPDSESSPSHYRRGKEGVRELCEDVNKRTGGMVEFIGDWHSHPDDHSTDLSNADLLLLVHHSMEMSRVGCPALIAIMGENGQLAFHLGKGFLQPSIMLIAQARANHAQERGTQ